MKIQGFSALYLHIKDTLKAIESNNNKHVYNIFLLLL